MVSVSKYAMEFIGLHAKVVKSGSKERIGISGLVIDETKNLLVIERKDGRIVKVPKADTLFRFVKDRKPFDIDGSRICFRPEDRPKKV
jgi:ribonuclease P protein subunit POP4